MKLRENEAQIQVGIGLGILSLGALCLLFCRFLAVGNLRYGYLGWNLFLAWIPLVCAVALNVWLQPRSHRWSAWQGVLLTVAWLAFLPNSFYLVSDLIHLRATGEVSMLFDAVLFMAFAFNGMILGFVALRLVHEEMLDRLSRWQSWALVSGVLLLSSFAIYLGRVQRWNSWDVLLHPAGIILDLSDNLANPSQGVNLINTTAMFLVLSIFVYVGLYKLVEGVRQLQD